MAKTEENNISFKNALIVFLIINIAMLIIRLRLFSEQSPSFHFYVFIGTFGFFVLGWKSLLLIHDYLNKVMPISVMPILRLVVQISFTTLLFSIFSIMMFSSVSYFFKIQITSMLNSFIYLLNFLIAIIFNLILFGTYYFYAWKKDLVQHANLEKEQAVVRYDALRNQLNPHFLFNALTSLNSLIFENQELASEFLQQLSKVYRYILQNKENDTVTLRTELNFIQHYIQLLKTRFGDALDIKVAINEEDMDRGMVPVITQTLIENALKHNTISSEAPLVINFTSDDNYLIVTNNLQKKSQVQGSNKLGLENLKSLYVYLSEIPVEIIETENTFTVKVPLI